MTTAAAQRLGKKSIKMEGELFVAQLTVLLEQPAAQHQFRQQPLVFQSP